MTKPHAITIGALFLPVDLRTRQRQVIERALTEARRDLAKAEQAHADSTTALLTAFELRAGAVHEHPDLTTEQKMLELTDLQARYVAQAGQLDQALANVCTYLLERIAELEAVLAPEPEVVDHVPAAVAVA